VKATPVFEALPADATVKLDLIPGGGD